MKKCLYILVLVGILVSIVFSACAPKSTAPAASPGKATTTKSESGGAAWDKVVEAAKKEGKLTAYNFFYSGEAGASFIKAFKDKYGITIEGVQGSAAVNVEKIKSERAAGKDAADIFETTVTGVWSLKAAGLLSPIGSELPVLKEKTGWRAEPVSDPEGMVLLYGIGYISPWINTNLVKPGDEPKSYKDFLDPKWKGKIVISDPRLTPMLARLYVTLGRNGTMDTSFFTSLAKQDIKWASSVNEAASILARGEAYANVPSTDMFEGPLLLKGAPLKPIDVAEGAVTIPAPGIGVLKNAPHPNAARVFVNWLLSDEGQKAFHQPRGGTSIRKDIPSFLPAGARLEPKKSFLSTPADDEQGSRVVREKEIAKLIGIEK